MQFFRISFNTHRGVSVSESEIVFACYKIYRLPLFHLCGSTRGSLPFYSSREL